MSLREKFKSRISEDNDVLATVKKSYQYQPDDKTTDDDVRSHLTSTEKGDEIDTVGFALETDNETIVKVFVNKDQAEDFEKALAELLGKEDNIDDALSQLSKDFDIIDVEWPDGEIEADENADEDAKKRPNDETVLSKEPKDDSQAMTYVPDEDKMSSGRGALNKRFRYLESVNEELSPDAEQDVDRFLNDRYVSIAIQLLIGLGVKSEHLELILTKDPQQKLLLKQQMIKLGISNINRVAKIIGVTLEK